MTWATFGFSAIGGGYLKPNPIKLNKIPLTRNVICGLRQDI